VQGSLRPDGLDQGGRQEVKRFRFALSGLEKVRQARVDEARLVLARSEARKRGEEVRIMTLEQKIKETAAKGNRDGVLDMTELLEEQEYLRDLRRQREDALTRLDGWIQAVEQDRQRLLQARREHKALERLRERRYLEFVKEVLREETQTTDEAGSYGHWDDRKRA